MSKIRFCIYCNKQLYGKNHKTCGSLNCIKLNKRIHSKKRDRKEYAREYARKRKAESEEYRIKCSDKNKNYYKKHKDKKCKQYKEWYQNNKDKVRDRLYRKKYGLTLEQVNDRIQSQNGVCPICDTKLTEPQVDHDHVSGAFRGVLCRKCNVSLGNVSDNITTLKRMIHYLENWINL